MTPSSAGRVRQATAAVASAAAEIEPDPERPAWHFRPPCGWMNDPSGGIWQGGRYHLFYQHNPYGDTWGDVHWGHAVSPDLVRWEHRPVALAPSLRLGEAHCFTGSAWRRADGVPVLFYSSFPRADAGRPAEQWAVLCGDDLETFEKWDGNPVLSLGDHGGPGLRDDWRDPFVFSEGGRVFLILGAVEAETGTPVIPLYEARDPTLLDWGYRGLLHRGDPEACAFFECPNLLRLGERHLLVYSAHRPVEWVLGRFDPADGSFDPGRRGRLDRGENFYATGRIAHEPDGRTVVVGWVRGWDAGRGWNGCLGLPRVLTVGPDGRPRQQPVPSVEGLRSGDAAGLPSPTVCDGRAAVEGVGGSGLELRARIRPAGASSCGLRLRPRGEGPGGGRTSDGAGPEPMAELRYRPDVGRLEVAGRSRPLRHRAGEPPAPAGERPRREVTRVPARPGPGGDLELRVFWDRSLLEVFVQQGREVCTRVMATRGRPARVEAFAEGGEARFPEFRARELASPW